MYIPSYPAHNTITKMAAIYITWCVRASNRANQRNSTELNVGRLVHLWLIFNFTCCCLHPKPSSRYFILRVVEVEKPSLQTISPGALFCF